MPVRLVLGISALLILTALGPTVAAAGKYPELELRKQGWTVDRLDLTGTDQPGTRHVSAEGRIMLPAQDVWEAIVGDSRKRNWPGVKESVVEWSNGDTSVRRYTFDIPIFGDRFYKLRFVRDDERMMLGFAMVPGYGNVREIRGTWEVKPLSDLASRVTYRLDTDPGVKLVPGFIINWATKKAIPRSFAYIHEVASAAPSQSLRLGGGD